MADKLLSAYSQSDGPRPLSHQPYYGRSLEGIKTYFNLPIYNNPIGIEVEAEGYGGLRSSLFCWNVTDDGSLKDSGVEFVSYPLYREYIDLALCELENMFKESPSLTFTHRCSIHVHVNVSNFSRYQLIALAGLYAIYERSLFEFVDPLRKGNSFCYPIVGTPTKLSFDWNTKYCAFNWTPIRKQLTVEYRHLEGTKDWQKLRRWVALVSKLTNFVGELPAKSARETILNVIQKGEGVQFARQVFGNTAILLNNLDQSIEHGSMWATSFIERSE